MPLLAQCAAWFGKDKMLSKLVEKCSEPPSHLILILQPTEVTSASTLEEMLSMDLIQLKPLKTKSLFGSKTKSLLTGVSIPRNGSMNEKKILNYDSI